MILSMTDWRRRAAIIASRQGIFFGPMFDVQKLIMITVVTESVGDSPVDRL